MLKTPDTVLLVRRCLILLSVGEALPSEMALSTLLRGAVVSDTSAAIVVMCWFSVSQEEGIGSVTSELEVRCAVVIQVQEDTQEMVVGEEGGRMEGVEALGRSMGRSSRAG